MTFVRGVKRGCTVMASEATSQDVWIVVLHEMQMLR